MLSMLQYFAFQCEHINKHFIYRGGQVKALFSSGHLVMEAVTMITVTVTATLTPSGHCPSAVLQKMVMFHGILKRAVPHLLLHTVVGHQEKNR
jgi:hypothetical protein